jgi:hypothetical protein
MLRESPGLRPGLFSRQFKTEYSSDSPNACAAKMLWFPTGSSRRTLKVPSRKNPYGPVAQGIEQQPSKLKVAGSNPAGVANKIGSVPGRAVRDYFAAK